jgi:hypothetical protein
MGKADGMSFLQQVLYTKTNDGVEVWPKPYPIPSGVGRKRILWDKDDPAVVEEITDDMFICSSCRCVRSVEEMHRKRDGNLGKLCSRCVDSNNAYRERKKKK